MAKYWTQGPVQSLTERLRAVLVWLPGGRSINHEPMPWSRRIHGKADESSVVQRKCKGNHIYQVLVSQDCSGNLAGLVHPSLADQVLV